MKKMSVYMNKCRGQEPESGADLSFGKREHTSEAPNLVLSCIKEFYFKFILQEKPVVKHSLAPLKSVSSCCDVRCTGMASPGEGSWEDSQDIFDGILPVGVLCL